MSDPENVIHLNGDHAFSRRAAWLDQVAHAYEKAAAEGGEPEALFFVAIRPDGGVTTSWDIGGHWKDVSANGAFLIAAEQLRRDAYGD